MNRIPFVASEACNLLARRLMYNTVKPSPNGWFGGPFIAVGEIP